MKTGFPVAADLWQPWAGGSPPTIEPVALKLRDGRTIEMPDECKPDWQHTGAGSDIVAYKVMCENDDVAKGEAA